jgi:SAM-dependent methyltransferase
MMNNIDAPEDLARNTERVIEAGLEKTGEILIKLASTRAGFESLADVDVLDMGCSTRFTQSIVNRNIPIKSYFGVEVRKPVVEYLQKHVSQYDSRFQYTHLNIQNELYNPEGDELSSIARIPGATDFDLIWLFSVFTHLKPDDSLAMLHLLRKHIRPNGKLFFTALVDEDVESFEDKVEDQPMLRAYYNPALMEELIVRSGWQLEKLYDRDLSQFIQNHYVCTPR